MVSLMRRREMMLAAGEPPEPWYVTDSLTHHWDAINNTGSGHSSSATSWADLIGTLSFVANNGSLISWDADALVLAGSSGQHLIGSANTTNASGRTIEVVFSTSTSQAATIVTPFYNSNSNTTKNEAYGKINLYSDDTFNVKGKSETAYVLPSGVSGLSKLHSITGTFSGAATVSKVYANAIAASKGSATHSLQGSAQKPSIGACPTGYGYPFTGKIHSIRIYNKQLSADEVAQNFAIDVARFNLEV